MMSLVTDGQQKKAEYECDFENKQKVAKKEKDILVNEVNGTMSVPNGRLQSNGVLFSAVKCESNIQNVKVESVCFSCKSEIGNLNKCSFETCDKLYHTKCLETFPSSKTEVSLCSHHICVTCYQINSKSGLAYKGKMYRCFTCPSAFHAKKNCHIPGAVILTQDLMSCPNHFFPEKKRDYPAVVNLPFCIQCGGNKDLKFCKSCPAAIHKECSKTKFKSDLYMCDRCESRKTISFDDIVWAKVYNFRWWPAKVVSPSELSTSVQKLGHFEGEFVIQFFETNDCYWTQHSRVYPFIHKKVGLEDKIIHFNFKKVISDQLFDRAVQSAIRAISDKKISVMDASSNTKPPHYRHIKSNRPIGNVQIYICNNLSDYNPCGCKAENPKPCGYDSVCLNRSMCTECHPDVCAAGYACENQMFQRLQYAPVKPFYTEMRGWGLKSLEDIKKGNFVIEYCGDLINEEECERRIKHKQEIGDTNFYYCTLDSTRIIDAGPKGNFSRFLNHSCEPNCESQKWIVNGDARVGIFAKRDIPADSELTFDYHMDFSHYEKLKCNCGSKRCSGLIGSKPQKYSRVETESDDEMDSSVTDLMKRKSSSKNGNCIKKSNAKEENGMKKNEGLKKRRKIDTESKDILQNGIKKVICFKCKAGGKLIDCSQKKCGKSFHIRCIKPKMESVPSKWDCPRHFCIKCKSNATFLCSMCPDSFCAVHVEKKFKSKLSCSKHS